MPDPVTPLPASQPGAASRTVTRRQVLGGIAGVAGLAAAPSLIAACSTPAASGAPSAASVAPGASASAAASSAVTGSTTLGSNYSNTGIDTTAMQNTVDAFTKKTGIAVKVNTTNHEDFQTRISSYLQGTPDDVFTWFAGYRMRTYANQGLAGDLTDLWGKIGSNFTDAFKKASTGDDGKQYFVPFYNYPWVVIYRKSLFADKGYTVPKTWTEFKALGDKMKKDGLIPLAFADKQGWPAMGTFDILNMRLNGYQFHVDLMAGKQKWADPKIKTVFETWKELLPYLQTGALARDWQDAAQGLVAKKSGMYFLGTFAGQQATKKEDHDDLDFFPFPTLGTEFDSELGIDAPIDGFMLTAKAKNVDQAKAFLEYLAHGEAQQIFLKQAPNGIPAGKDADTSGFSAFDKKSAEIIGASGAIAQYLDRDTKPAFADEMIKKLQAFLTDPNQDLGKFTDAIQKFWDSLGD